MNATTNEIPAPARLAYSIERAAEALSVSKRLIESLIASRHLATFRVGRRRLIAATELERFISEAQEGGGR